MAPQLPYIDVPKELPIPLIGRFFDGSPPTLKLFGGIVAFGVYLGILLATRRAKERRIPSEQINTFIWWFLIGGFVGAHVLDDVFYHPDEIAKNPLHLLMLWVGISSYGGFIGAVGTAFAYGYIKKISIANMAEVVISSFPVAWVFGRLGCATVHDHPGRVSQSWIAVQYPNLPPGWGRFDLGLYEMLLSIPLAAAFLILWKRKVDRPRGFYAGLMCAYYAPVRFVLDFFRETEANMKGAGDPRYGGLTPAQWGCFALLGVGIYFLTSGRKSGSTIEPEPLPEPAIDDDEEEPPVVVAAKPKKKRKKRPSASIE